MEFAVSALLLLILLLPGFILQLSYTKGLWRWNSPIVNRPITELVPSSIILAGALHLVWAPIASQIEPIRFDVLMMFLLGNFGHEEEFFAYAMESITGHPYKIAFYFLTLFTFAAIVGYAAHTIVRRNCLDHKHRFLRFSNEWFYWLSGEITQFSETENVDGTIFGVYLTTVVHHEGANYLYTGFVIDYYFDKAGILDRVILNRVQRRRLRDDQAAASGDDRYYDIDGNYFILRYSEMSTINLRYLLVIGQSPQQGSLTESELPARTETA
jgi:hypothetical protein